MPYRMSGSYISGWKVEWMPTELGVYTIDVSLARAQNFPPRVGVLPRMSRVASFLHKSKLAAEVAQEFLIDRQTVQN